MASKTEQGWYQVAIGAAVAVAGVALDDPALVGAGVGTAIGGVAQVQAGNDPAPAPAAAPPPIMPPAPAAAGASPNDVVQPSGAGTGDAVRPSTTGQAGGGFFDKKTGGVDNKLLVLGLGALFFLGAGR